MMRSHIKFFLLVLGLLSACSVSVAWAQYPGFGDPGATSGSLGGAGGMVPVEEDVDGGSIPMGASAQVVVRFRNDGGQPIETGLIRLYPSSTVSANVSLDQCKEEPLQGGAECAVAITIKALQPGEWRVELLMSHSGRARLVSTTLSGDVDETGESSDTLASDIQAIPDEIDFETLNSAQTLVEPVILRNITSETIDLSEIYIDSSEQAGYKLKTDCESLQAGQACIATITWSPVTPGRSSGVLVIKHSGPTGLSSVPLMGEFEPEDTDVATVFPQAVPGKGLLVSSQEEIDFGEEVSTASALTVSLVNAGDAAITLSDLQISGSDNGLGFKEKGCMAGTVLQPVEACPLTVTWSPTRVGTVFDDIQILHDGARGVMVLPVRGSATSTVSQDQKAIVLSEGGGSFVVPPISEDDLDDEDRQDQREQAAENNSRRVTEAALSMPTVANAAGVLDGFKITSFSPTRAIINGPGGSRLVFNNEETVLGGVPFMVMIQKNGIEFVHQSQRVLLLFDRSLSSINRVTASSDNAAAPSGNTTAVSPDTGI